MICFASPPRKVEGVETEKGLYRRPYTLKNLGLILKTI